MTTVKNTIEPKDARRAAYSALIKNKLAEQDAERLSLKPASGPVTPPPPSAISVLAPAIYAATAPTAAPAAPPVTAIQTTPAAAPAGSQSAAPAATPAASPAASSPSPALPPAAPTAPPVLAAVVPPVDPAVALLQAQLTQLQMQVSAFLVPPTAVPPQTQDVRLVQRISDLEVQLAQTTSNNYNLIARLDVVEKENVQMTINNYNLVSRLDVVDKEIAVLEKKNLDLKLKLAEAETKIEFINDFADNLSHVMGRVSTLEADPARSRSVSPTPLAAGHLSPALVHTSPPASRLPTPLGSPALKPMATPRTAASIAAPAGPVQAAPAPHTAPATQFQAALAPPPTSVMPPTGRPPTPPPPPPPPAGGPPPSGELPSGEAPKSAHLQAIEDAANKKAAIAKKKASEKIAAAAAAPPEDEDAKEARLEAERVVRNQKKFAGKDPIIAGIANGLAGLKPRASAPVPAPEKEQCGPLRIAQEKIELKKQLSDVRKMQKMESDVESECWDTDLEESPEVIAANLVKTEKLLKKQRERVERERQLDEANTKRAAEKQAATDVRRAAKAALDAEANKPQLTEAQQKFAARTERAAASAAAATAAATPAASV